MSKPRVPSLQHFARNWHQDPQRVRKDLFDIGRNGPPFSYLPLNKLVQQQLVFGDDYDQLVECIRRLEQREQYQNDFIDAFGLLHEHFRTVNPDYAKEVTGRFYPISRELLVPFTPPLVYRSKGVLVFPWISFWRRHPLSGERLSLFVTMVEELLLQDPDFENVIFQILDLSVSVGDEKRSLSVIDTRDIPRISYRRKLEMLESFAKGYALAKADLAKSIRPEPLPPTTDPNQLLLL